MFIYINNKYNKKGYVEKVANKDVCNIYRFEGLFVN